MISGTRLASATLQITVTVALLLYVFSQTPLELAIDAAGNADLLLFFLAGVVLVIYQYLTAWKLLYLVRPQGIVASISKLFEINLVAHFYGCVLPLSSVVSSVVRWYQLSVLQGRRAQAFAAVAFNRVLEFLLVCIIGGFAWLVDFDAGRSSIAGWIIGSVFMLAVAGYAVIVSGRLTATLRTIPPRIGKFLPSVASRIDNVISALDTYPTLTLYQHVRLLAISLLRNLSVVIALYALAHSIGIAITVITVAWVRSATTLLMFLPISVLGLGIREASLLFLLRPYGVAEQAAVALGLLWLGASLVVGAVGGILEVRTRVLGLFR